MDINLILLTVILISLIVLIYFVILKKKKGTADETKDNLIEEITRLKDALNQSINSQMSSMATSFNSLSKDVTRDMTKALTEVDQKVGTFNKQVEGLSKSSENFTRILSGVKQYGVLA